MGAMARFVQRLSTADVVQDLLPGLVHNLEETVQHYFTPLVTAMCICVALVLPLLGSSELSKVQQDVGFRISCTRLCP
jgi:hypothetical protein